jgi:myosin-5
MSQKTRVSPSLQSIKSLPGDFRFMGLPTSHPSENSEDVNQRKGNMVPIATIPENGDSTGEVVEGGEDGNNDTNQDPDESPYGRFDISVETRPSVGSEDLDLAPPLCTSAPLGTESKWGDTNPYAAKKVCQGIQFQS